MVITNGTKGDAKMPFVYVYKTEESSVPTEKIYCNTLGEAIRLDLELNENGIHSIVVE